MVRTGVPASSRRTLGDPSGEPEVGREAQAQPVSAKLVSSVARAQAEYLVLGRIGLGADVTQELPPGPDPPDLAEVPERAGEVEEQPDHLGASASPDLGAAGWPAGGSWARRAILTEAVRSRVYSRNLNHQVVR